MPKEKVNKDRETNDGEQLAVESTSQRRQRLAQLIGRLLARTWLKRRRDAECDSATRNNSESCTD